ncbi:MAG: flippase [Cetobacterium sp.]
MKFQNIKLNFILNISRLFLGTFFILLTMPYIARVLGSENLGNIEYVNSIISYFLLFTALGIPNYGIREVAKVRDNKKLLNQTVIELLVILLITTIIGYFIFFILLNSFEDLSRQKLLFLIMGTNIIFSNIGVEWFYQGIENQLYITIRFIIIRSLSLILLFLFVKKPDDYYIYGGILVLIGSGSNIFNFINLRKYINIRNIEKLNLKRHIKPVLTIFSATLASSIYLQLDSVMIGSMVGTEYVAFYSIANKLVRLILVLVTALGIVMIPRLSKCLKEDNIEGYKSYANISLKYILFIAVPSTVVIFLLSKEIILIMAGEAFIESILTIQIVSPIILIFGLAYFIGFQVLYPYNLEKYYTYAVTLAAVMNFVFNYIFIPKYAQNGAAVGTIIAELTGLLMVLYFARKKIKNINFYNIENLKYFIATLIMGMIIFFLKKLDLSNLEKLIISVTLGGITYLTVLFLLKEYFVLEGIKIIKSKLKRS